MRWPWQAWKSAPLDGEDLRRRVSEAQFVKDRADRLKHEAAPLVELARQQRRENGFAKAIEESMRGKPWRDRPA